MIRMSARWQCELFGFELRNSEPKSVIKTTKLMWNRDIKSIRYWNENNSSTSYSEKVAKRLSFCSSPGRNVSNFCWNLAVKRQISSKCEKITLKKFPQQNESYWLAFRSQDRTNEGTHHRKLFKFVHKKRNSIKIINRKCCKHDAKSGFWTHFEWLFWTS